MSSTVVVLGSSGEVGRQAVLHALRSASAAKVYSVGRSEPPNVYPLTPGFDKLVHVPLDYDKLHAGDAEEARKLRELGADVVLSAFGTSKAKAGGAEQFVRIDREFALAGARAARVEGKEQTLVYCSSASADPDSSMLYFQSKGLTEEGLAALGYSRTIVLRPSTLIVPGGRKGEAVHKAVFCAVSEALSHLNSSVAAPTPEVGAALVRVAFITQGTLAHTGIGREEKLKGRPVWVLNNKQILEAGR